MIMLCLLGVIALMTGMLVIEGNATDRAEKRADLMTNLYNKNVSVSRRLKEDLDSSNAMLEHITKQPVISNEDLNNSMKIKRRELRKKALSDYAKSEKKQPKKKSAVRQRKT